MHCPNCHGPISQVRGLGKSQPQDKALTFYRCLICGADFVVVQEAAAAKTTQRSGSLNLQLQLVWPRAMG
jgi:hypothetical protein